MRKLILFIASLLLLLILPAGFQEARAEDSPFCINLKWWRSADADLSAVQQNVPQTFASVNGKDLSFNWIPGSEQPPFPNGRHDTSFLISSSLSRACFPRSFLLPGKNLFALKFGWDNPISSGNAEANMVLSNGQGEIFLCREAFKADGGGEHGCKRDVELELSQIDPELAAKIAQLAGVNESIAKELEGLQGNYKALKAFMDALEKRVNELGKSLFDVLTEGDFKGYERELVEVLDLIRSHKAMADALRGDTKKVLADAKADAEAIKAALEDVLRRDGATIEDVSVSVPEIEDLEISLPEPEDQTDPFDPANDPYDKIANATIELIQRNWPDRRFEIIVTVNAWNQKQKDMESGLAARSHASPAEIAAYHQSIRKVRGFILDTGCDGKGCLTDDGWFTDVVAKMPTLHSFLTNKSFPVAKYDPEIIEAWKAALNRIKTLSPDRASEIENAGLSVLSFLGALLEDRILADDAERQEHARALRAVRGAALELIQRVETVAEVGLAATPIGLVIEICEIATGRERCVAKKAELGLVRRTISAAMIIGFNSKVMRTAGETISAGLGVKASDFVFISERVAAIAGKLKSAGISSSNFLNKLKVLTYEGKYVADLRGITVYRRLEKTFTGPDWNVVMTADGRAFTRNIESAHRYSEEGLAGIYVSTLPETTEAELKYWFKDRYNPDNYRVASKIVNLDGILDLRKPESVLELFGIDLSLLRQPHTDDGHAIPQLIGVLARKAGYKGIIVKSAQTDIGFNIVLFSGVIP